ncbi:MAG: tyrosine-type recombinase/integrase [Candidatus Aenigmarchaeota archaeon]|nr:tyrosine-type recombinase/integrase [Candidatus Aenigmarchaeota archaeon]
MTKRDIYLANKKFRDAIKLLKESNITNRNKLLIEKFSEFCFAESLGVHRVVKYIYTLKNIAQELDKDFDKAKKDDIIKVVGKIEKSNYSSWTKKDYKVTIKKFYKWLRGGEEYPEEVKWIKTTIKRSERKLPEDLLTEEDIQKLLQSAKNIRDKAFIATLYETGARIGEIASVRIKDIIFDKHGAILIIDGKTGMRRNRVILADPYLRQYINQHPYKDNPEASLWLKQDNKPLTYTALSKIIKETAKKAGIKKKIHAHLFRHSRATYLAQHLTEAQLCAYLGWKQGSEMPSVYIHLSGRDIDKAILGIYGIKIEDTQKREPKLKPKRCPRCNALNTPEAKFCTQCGLALDISTAMKLKQFKDLANEIMTHPKYAHIKRAFLEWFR